MLFFQSIGAWVLGLIAGTGKSILLLLDILGSSGKIFKRFGLLIRQIYYIGVMSLPIILVSGFFVGMVLGFQFYLALSMYGAESSLGTTTAFSILRELGPVVCALLFAGRAGSAITSEIGLMKATEQISSMEMMAVRAVEYVCLPRFYAVIISVPLLTILFSSVAILGAYLVGVVQLGVDSGAFWGMSHNISFWGDVFQGVIVKGFIFGLVAAVVSIYQGYNCNPTSKGIGLATTRTVVVTSLLIFAFDFILTSLFFGIN